MTHPTADLFADRADAYESMPVPQQIAAGVASALHARVPLLPTMQVLDFGAGTGLVSGAVAPHVAHVTAVDISAAMLTKLSEKPELAGKVTCVEQDILQQPLPGRFDLVVSAMAMHHVKDTDALLAALFARTAPGGSVALADLDSEDGSFHSPGIEGVFHAGFDRQRFTQKLQAAGFVEPTIATACEVTKDERRYPIFLATARKPD